MDKTAKILNTLKYQLDQDDTNIINSIKYASFNGPINGLVRFSKKLSQENRKQACFFDIDLALRNIFYNIRDSLIDFPSSFNSLLITKRQRDINTLERQIKEYLATYLTHLEFYGNYSGASDDLLRRHNDFMQSNKLSPLSCTSTALTHEFSFEHNINAPLHETLVKSQFWTNKFVKYFSASLPATLLFASDRNKFSKIDYNVHDKISERDKYVSLCKAQFFNAFYKETSSNLLPPDIGFNDLLFYYDSIVHFEEYDSSPELRSRLKETPVPPNDLLNLTSDVAKTYNSIFSNVTPNTTFIDDAITAGNNLSITSLLYSVKNELTKSLLNVLLIERSKPVKKFLHYGVSYDETNIPILTIDVPDHIGRSSVHVPDILLCEPSVESVIKSMPEYKSFIDKSYIIMPASSEQKKYIKEELNKSTSFNNLNRRNLLTQYCGMACSDYREFYKALNNEKVQ